MHFTSQFALEVNARDVRERRMRHAERQRLLQLNRDGAPREPIRVLTGWMRWRRRAHRESSAERWQLPTVTTQCAECDC